MKTTPLTTSLTFGRMNLPHPGHVDLIRRMLEVSDQAVVGVSAGRLNNDPETRIELLVDLCERAGLPLENITCMVSSNPYALLDEWLTEPYTGLVDIDLLVNTTIVLGVDQTQLGERLRDDYGIKFVPNEVRVGSSTVIRYFLDCNQHDVVREIYHNDDNLYLKVLALRNEELAREKP